MQFQRYLWPCPSPCPCPGHQFKPMPLSLLTHQQSSSDEFMPTPCPMLTPTHKHHHQATGPIPFLSIHRGLTLAPFCPCLCPCRPLLIHTLPLDHWTCTIPLRRDRDPSPPPHPPPPTASSFPTTWQQQPLRPCPCPPLPRTPIRCGRPQPYGRHCPFPCPCLSGPRPLWSRSRYTRRRPWASTTIGSSQKKRCFPSRARS
mmetsp:Transcript_43597/g.70790  ORF Transcript_43597/g.70790 Transcript_43597/m.70790 type:complete len:201 (+) Transcript_43597:2550-3152(+)